MLYTRENLDTFLTALLDRLNMGRSNWRLEMLREQVRCERGDFDANGLLEIPDFNPLDTQRVMNQGETFFNVTSKDDAGNPLTGVKNYPSFAIGVEATGQTLELPYYRNYLTALRNQSITSVNLSTLAGEIRTYGTGQLATELEAGWAPTSAPEMVPNPDHTFTGDAVTDEAQITADANAPAPVPEPVPLPEPVPVDPVAGFIQALMNLQTQVAASDDDMERRLEIAGLAWGPRATMVSAYDALKAAGLTPSTSL